MKYQDELQELKAQNTGYHNWIKYGINFIRNLPERFTDWDFAEKQKLLVRYLLKKLQFDGKKSSNRFCKDLKKFSI